MEHAVEYCAASGQRIVLGGYNPLQKEIEVGFGHASFLGIDLLKFQVSSYSALDKIDVGIYISTTAVFQRRMKSEFKQNWEGSLTFEKIAKHLPQFKSAIQVPIYVIGLDF